MHATVASPAQGVSGVPAADRKVRCRYLTTGKRGQVDQCTGEAVDPDGEILLCILHLGRALELLRQWNPMIAAAVEALTGPAGDEG
jgi:hypothetical protein